MPSKLEEISLAEAFDAASDDFVKSNRKSEEIHKMSVGSTPGGTTRNVLFMKPFPLVMSSGAGPYLTSVDGRRYLDLCGEYSACLFGHSHPVVIKAMHDAVDGGIALGSINVYEGKLTKILCDRFPSIDKIRFTNSGTEASTTCISLLRAYRKKDTFIVFEGGYHGGLTTFATEKETNMAASGHRSMNVPHKFVIAPYNDVAALERLVAQNKDDLAAIMLEPMQGSSGCIPADVDFLKACRAQATASGAVLVFDEVMTSRMSVGGYQKVLGIYPDMTLLGKYLAGGGCNFGAFGGRADIMDLLDPSRPTGDGVYHSGTYSNNVITMATAVATMEQVWNPEASQSLWDQGVWLREELNALSTRMGTSLHVSGTGSLMAVHFTEGGKPVRCAADVKAGNALLKELFFLDMLKKGFFFARRGQVSIMSVHTREQLITVVDAVREFLEERKQYVAIVP